MHQLGFGRTIMPYARIHALVQSGELVAVPLVDPVPACRVVMVYPADRPVLPAARFIGQAVATIASDLVGCGAWARRLIADMNAPEYAGKARVHESAL